MARKTITITAEMEERWVPQFVGLLEHMEYLGKVGSSRMLGFYADGDGDFRPLFVHDIEDVADGHSPNGHKVDLFWDAG